MLNVKGISQTDLILAISESLDLISPVLTGHHKRVAYMALNIAQKLNMERKEIKDLIFAALLHDVGALSLKERIDTLQFDLVNPHFHAKVGYSLLSMYKPFQGVSDIVKYHHIDWNQRHIFESQGHIPFSSYILHLADRVDVLLNADDNESNGLKYVIKRLVDERGKKFNPDVVDALLDVINRETVMESLRKESFVPAFYFYLGDLEMNIDELLGITRIIEKIVDFRSRFTATHSGGVAYVAEKLADYMGLPETERKMIKVAGNLHDIGKLGIPNFLLEKPGKLTKEEFNRIKYHALYTYLILKKVRGLQDVHEWSAFHHEKLNGRGYPFGKKDKELSLGSRIMAVADVFTAITEDRPYRKGMTKKDVLSILEKMVERNEIDGDVTSVLKYNYDDINDGRIKVQRNTIRDFEEFCWQIHKK